MTDPAPTPPPEFPISRAGVVALVGRANVGKSSLLNALLEEKVSIVSPVAQTTRNVIRAILTDPRGQLVFLDTPGIHKSGTDLGRLMNRAARAAAEGVDVVLLVLDSSEPPRQEDEGWMNRLQRAEVPVIAVLNKKDLGLGEAEAYRAAWLKAGGESPKPVEWFEVSATTNEGVVALCDRLLALMPVGPLLFPADVLTDYPRKLNIGDVVREKLFHELREELPHAVTVWIDEVDEAPDGWTVRGSVYVNKPSQKGIVIGDKGRLLRKVKRAAEIELQVMYNVPVSLDLWVKVEPNWNRNFWLLKKFGYA